MAQGQGSVEFPVQLDHYQKVVEVGWPQGRIATVAIEAEVNHARVDILDPSAVDFDRLKTFVFDGEHNTLTVDDYKDYRLVTIANIAQISTVVVENAIPNVVVGDGMVAGDAHYSGNPIAIAQFDQEIADVSAQIGRGPDASIEPGTFNTVFNSITQPNGHVVTYIDHYDFPITSTPPDFDWTEWDTYLWWHTTTIPEQRVDIIRQSWLVNFGKKNDDPAKVSVAAVVNHIASSLPSETVKFEIKIYPHGNEFTRNPDARLVPTKPNLQPTVEASGTVSAAIATIITRFDKNGLIP